MSRVYTGDHHYNFEGKGRVCKGKEEKKQWANICCAEICSGPIQETGGPVRSSGRSDRSTFHEGRVLVRILVFPLETVQYAACSLKDCSSLWLMVDMVLMGAKVPTLQLGPLSNPKPLYWFHKPFSYFLSCFRKVCNHMAWRVNSHTQLLPFSQDDCHMSYLYCITFFFFFFYFVIMM